MSSSNNDDKTIAELENEGLKEFNRQLKESLDREAKMHRHFYWKGNKLPPFNIEPMPYERERLEKPMTDEDRFLRKQWLDDQVLAPHEPVYIPQLYPRNPIKRFFGKPWDVVFNTLRPVIGEERAFMGRYLIPKYALALLGFYGFCYYFKFHQATWTDRGGLHVYSSRGPVFNKADKIPDKVHDDFFDQGFKHRKIMRDVKTSGLP